MQLVSLAKNPVPGGAYVGMLQAHDGVALRFARWAATRGPRRGTVCLFGGRGEYIEKYFEVIADLRRRGFAVATMDWRGQGGSDRLTSNPRKGHVHLFEDYERDLRLFMREVVLPDCPPPFIALAHSMGGNILMRTASRPGSWFERMVLCAPLIEFAPEILKTPVTLATLYAEAACLAGLGKAYVPGGSDVYGDLVRFEGNALTPDRERWTRNKAVLDIAPHLAIGSPTMGWLRAALRSMSMLSDPAYPHRVQVPMLLFSPGKDAIVSHRAIEDFGASLKVGTQVRLPGAQHEILQERDSIRMRFFAAFDAYLGIEEPRLSGLAG